VFPTFFFLLFFFFLTLFSVIAKPLGVPRLLIIYSVLGLNVFMHQSCAVNLLQTCDEESCPLAESTVLLSCGFELNLNQEKYHLHN
jgi:hypothetical protein